MAKKGKYSQTKKCDQVIDEILDQISVGKSLVGILKSKKEYPHYSNFMRWIDSDEKLREKYARAKEEQADYLAEQLLEIADDGSNDWMLNNDPDNPGYKFNGEHHQRSRLRVDTRKWIASKLKPKKYGEKLELGATPDLKACFALPALKKEGEE
ncbi:MAG: terminase small subunit protein [Pseudobdellovibrionaceae bacterium]